MVELSMTSDVCILWTAEPWQCQLWGPPESGYLVLMNGAHVAVRRPAEGVNDVRQAAKEWFERYAGEFGRSGFPEPSRRYFDDRRRRPDAAHASIDK